MAQNVVEIGGLFVNEILEDLIREDIAPETEVEPEAFWTSLNEIVQKLGPRNQELLRERDALQVKIDTWYNDQRGQEINLAEHIRFLKEIGYLLEEGENYQVTTKSVDPEISSIAGPQLVVPLDNRRYSLNAANARWGSLYDALYGSDIISEDEGLEKGQSYNPHRGNKVIAIAETFLDKSVTLTEGLYSQVIAFEIKNEPKHPVLAVTLKGGRKVGLADKSQFVGYNLADNKLSSVLLKNNGLHIEIQINRNHPIGTNHPAGVKDIVLESAITTIQDCEDSVAAVDAADKATVYRNWAGIMKGDIHTTFEKNGQQQTRVLNADRTYIAADGGKLTLSGRSLLLVRNVGIHMYTDAVTTANGNKIPEGFLDAMVTALAALHDLKGTGRYRNSSAGSIYIVKPKLHGPEEVAATIELFEHVEHALGLAQNTLKIGIMDEERRTTVNLKESIRPARERVFFINTGFLDRTGDEIHTCTEAGPIMPKPDIKNHKFLSAYEDWNVDIGLEIGLPEHAQIGKGMWTMPNRMKDMMTTKLAHPKAGASTAWVPSPTAATLHATHYHEVNVKEKQTDLATRQRANLKDILTPPLLDRTLTPEEIRRELDNNAQGVLGYVVRWIDQGVGCSKVPDINNIGLMEDRATLRISSQHIANWLQHDLISIEQVHQTFIR